MLIYSVFHDSILELGVLIIGSLGILSYTWVQPLLYTSPNSATFKASVNLLFRILIYQVMKSLASQFHYSIILQPWFSAIWNLTFLLARKKKNLRFVKL